MGHPAYCPRPELRPRRDDAQKLRPCLVPYAALPDSEKEFDRITALGTIKAILSLGYRITPPSP